MVILLHFQRAARHPAWISDSHESAQSVVQSLLAVFQVDLPTGVTLNAHRRGLVVEISILF